MSSEISPNEDTLVTFVSANSRTLPDIKNILISVYYRIFSGSRAYTHARIILSYSPFISVYESFKMAKSCCVCSDGKETTENRLFRCGGSGCGIIVHQGSLKG